MTEAVKAVQGENLPDQITVRVGRVYECDTRKLLAEDLIEGEPTLEKLLEAAEQRAMRQFDAEVDFFTENIEDFVSPKAFVSRAPDIPIECRDIAVNSGQIRCLNFADYNRDDPFVIGHDDPAQLADDVLKTHYANFKAAPSGGYDEGEDGEDGFISYLRTFGYFNLIVSDETLVL